MHVTTAQEPELCRSCWLRITQGEVELNQSGAHEGEWRWQLAAAAACGVLGIVGWGVAQPGLALGCHMAAYIAGGWFAVGETWEKLQEKKLDVHFLMLAVASGAAAIGEWSEGVVLLFLFSFAGALEHYAMERTQREIRSLIDTAPKTASLVLSDGTLVEVPVGQLRPGHLLRLLPGALFPVDGELVTGETAVDESTLTGEAMPVEKRAGDAVMAGTVNGWGMVEVRVTRLAEESALQRIIRLIRDAQRQKAPSQRFTDRFGSGYTLGVLGLTVVMFLVWWLVFGRVPFAAGGPLPSAFYQAMTLLVVASPCALVLSVPSAILAAIAAGARRGILFRGGVAVEQLAEIELVAMDKTGTLTTGELRVESVESFPAGRETEVAELAYALERLSTHPLARAVTRYGKQHRLAERELVGFASVTGCGLKAETGGAPVRLGKRAWVLEVAPAEGAGRGDAQEGGEPGEDSLFSEVWVASGGLLGRMRLRDDVRPESRPVVQALHDRGLRTIVLTGDRAEAAAFLSESLGVQEVRAGLKPEEKLEYITTLSRSGRHAAMIGDGINDAPSLAAAHVGVAMGARGADAALEQADLVLMHDRLENFLHAYDLSVSARRVIRQNVGISLGVITVLVGFALAGRIPLTLGVLGHEGSTLLVVLNSLRLLAGGAPPRPVAKAKHG
jgi:Cd2+/Zn2+-exporting ATPase